MYYTHKSALLFSPTWDTLQHVIPQTSLTDALCEVKRHKRTNRIHLFELPGVVRFIEMVEQW